MVNILLMDNDDVTVQFMGILSENKKQFRVIQAVDFDDAMDKYTNNAIDFVIVDFSYAVYDAVYKEIMKINPKQKIITLSYEVKCSSTLGCAHCVENAHEKRLLKPFNPKDLLSLLTNFENGICKYYNSFQNIETIMGDIVKRYVGCIYDANTKIVSFFNSDYMTTESMENLSDILNKHNVTYSILDNLNIKIGNF